MGWLARVGSEGDSDETAVGRDVSSFVGWTASAEGRPGPRFPSGWDVPLVGVGGSVVVQEGWRHRGVGVGVESAGVPTAGGSSPVGGEDDDSTPLLVVLTEREGPGWEGDTILVRACLGRPQIEPTPAQILPSRSG